VLRDMYFLSFAPRSRTRAHSVFAGLPADAASSAGPAAPTVSAGRRAHLTPRIN